MNLRHALQLAVLLLLLPACERGDQKELATPANTPSAPETVATLRPNVTPESTLAASTAVPARTPQPEASATPLPDARQDGLSFHFGRDVDPFDRSLIERAVEVTRDLLRDESGLQPPAAVFAYESPGELADAFAGDALAQAWRADGMAGRLTRTIAEASYRGIVINTGLPVWKAMDATQRLRVVAHEFVHVIQLEHAGPQVADATFTSSNTVAPDAGPFWLLEGSAEVVSWLVLQELNLGAYADALLDYAAGSKGSSPGLQPLEAYFGFAQAGQAGVGMSVLATDYLLRSRSLSGLFEFWTEVGRGAAWQTAFTRHFGLPPQFFYEAFTEYYETVWARSVN
jgi:hypothetical protein